MNGAVATPLGTGQTLGVTLEMGCAVKCAPATHVITVTGARDAG
jgi:hypothetical protein